MSLLVTLDFKCATLLMRQGIPVYRSVEFFTFPFGKVVFIISILVSLGSELATLSSLLVMSLTWLHYLVSSRRYAGGLPVVGPYLRWKVLLCSLIQVAPFGRVPYPKSCYYPMRIPRPRTVWFRSNSLFCRRVCVDFFPKEVTETL